MGARVSSSPTRTAAGLPVLQTAEARAVHRHDSPTKMPALRSAHLSLKGLAKVEAELTAPLEGVDFYRTAEIEWTRPLKAAWAGLDERTRAELKEAWQGRLLRPQRTNEVNWERLLLRTLYPQDYKVLVQRSLTQIPSDPQVPLPESLRAASTRFLRDLASELHTASLDRRLRSPEHRAIRDSAPDPLLAKLVCLNRLLVERARWGDAVEPRELQPDLATDLHKSSPAALQLAQLSRAAALALGGVLKRAELAPHDELGEAFILELRDGTRRTVPELYDPNELSTGRSQWAKSSEQKLSLALAMIAHPRQPALRALWDELHRFGRSGIEAALLIPAISAKPASGEAGRRFEGAVQGVVEAINGGADRATVAAKLARIIDTKALPEGRRARAILQLFGAVEAHPHSPGAIDVIQRLITLGRGLAMTPQFYAGSLATRALVAVGQAQAIDPLLLDHLGFEVLTMTSSPSALSMRQASLTESGLFDPQQIEDLLKRVQVAEGEYLAQAVGERRPDVGRFLSALSKQRARIAKGLETPVEGGLPGAIAAAFSLRAPSGRETVHARIDRVLPELEQAWGREPCAANSLYGAALLAAIGDAHLTGALAPLLSKAQTFIEAVAAAGHHGGIQRYLAALLAQGPQLLGVDALHGPAYETAALDPVVAQLRVLPNDPWAMLAHVHALSALLPSARSEALAPMVERAAGLLLSGEDREARELLLGLQPSFEAGFLRPPVLDERVEVVDKIWEADLLLRAGGVLDRLPALDAFSETPTAENLAAARTEWAPIKARAMAKANLANDRRRASIEIAVNLIDAVLAPTLDVAWINALEMMVDKARAADRREAPPRRVVPEAALAWALEQLGGGGPHTVDLLADHELRRAIGKELQEAARGAVEQRRETLALAQRLLGRCLEAPSTNPLRAEVLTQALRDVRSAEAGGLPELGLHLLIGTLTDLGYTDGSYEAGALKDVAASGFASRFRALDGPQPEAGTSPREFAASVVGSLRILSACLPNVHPLRPSLDGAIARGLRALLAGSLEEANEHLRGACRIGGSLSFDPWSRRTFGRDGDAPGPTSVKVRSLRPGDVVHLDAPPDVATSPIACFGGRLGDRDYFTGPRGDTWSMKIDPTLEVQRFSSLARLWEHLALQPGAMGGWTYAPTHSGFRDAQRFGRLERGQGGALELRIADGTSEALDLEKLKELQVGLSRDDYLQRFVDQHLGEWVLLAHQGAQSVGVLLHADAHHLELRGISGDLVIIERAQLDNAQSAAR